MSRTNTEGYWFACVDRKVATDPELSPVDKAVFAVLCSHIDNNRECCLKVATIAHEAGCSERSVQTTLKKLAERGIIERINRFVNNEQRPSLYKIIGDKAPCYATNGEVPSSIQGAGDSPGGCTTCTQNENLVNDIKDSLTGEAELPDYADLPIAFENGQPVDPENPPQPEGNLDEALTPDDAPDIMRPTARYFLQQTGRHSLTWQEINSLHILANTQYPARVQKEIDTAASRFLRKGKPLTSLTLCYIAGSLQHQHSLKGKRKTSTKPDREAVIDNSNADEEMAYINAMMAKIDEEAAQYER